MKKIPLTRGKFALIDDVDFDTINAKKWTFTSGGYAAHYYRIGKKVKSFRMHRFLLDPPRHMEIDHINRNGLDNRRCNLRICTREENARNVAGRAKWRRFKGVRKTKKGWFATICFHGQHFRKGPFTRSVVAAITYDHWAKVYHGEFASLNFPPQVSQDFFSPSSYRIVSVAKSQSILRKCKVPSR